MPIKWPTKYNKATSRHTEWQALKKKHESALKAGKVNFASDFGTAIDNFETQIKKVANADFARTATINDLEVVSQAGSKAQDIARKYKTKLASVADPAKTAFLNFLNSVDTDAQIWQDNTLFESSAGPAWKIAEWDACPSLDGHLELVSRHAALGIKAIDADPALKAQDVYKKLRTRLVAIETSGTAAHGNAKLLHALYINALGNPAYLGVLKADTAKALKGPYVTILKELHDLTDWIPTEGEMKKYTVARAVDVRAVLKAYEMVLSNMMNLTKAEKALVVTT